ncbi:hypothetical protein, partial [Siminovitchia fortis]|uniref:hypothetical protein n=1 Tax=Siminovitchia fortis TaxID=254758 RepID=UPI00164358EA
YDLEAVGVGDVRDDKMVRLVDKGEVVGEVAGDGLGEDGGVYDKKWEVGGYFGEFEEMEVNMGEVID